MNSADFPRYKAVTLQGKRFRVRHCLSANRQDGVCNTYIMTSNDIVMKPCPCLTLHFVLRVILTVMLTSLLGVNPGLIESHKEKRRNEVLPRIVNIELTLLENVQFGYGIG